MNNHTNQSIDVIMSNQINPEFLQNWIELSKSAVEHNAAQFQQWLGKNTRIAAVIKSNAYGHGLIDIARLYNQCKNITAVCTINLTEAVCIRQDGMTKPILVIGYLDADYNVIVEHNIIVALYDFNIACKLNEVGKKHKKKIPVHIKFDTGMSRLGVKEQDLDMFIDQIKNLPWIKIQGIFSHLAQSYDQKRTDEQEDIFAQACTKNISVHLSNSHGTLTTKKNKYHFARIGIGLYGYLQKYSLEDQKKLFPVLSLKTRILQIKQIEAGTKIGYDDMFQAINDMTIAILAIGYGEGLDARLSNCGKVIINDQFAPIVGRICMNLTIIDISHISQCYVGQIVTILGKETTTSISVYDWSELTKASVYDHLTKLSTIVPKIITP